MTTPTVELLGLTNITEAYLGTRGTELLVPGGTPALSVASVAGAFLGPVGEVVVTFVRAVTLSGPALLASNWGISGGGVAVTPLTVAGAGAVVTLTTTTQTQGGAYSLSIPTAGVTDAMAAGLGFGGPFTRAFTGASNGPQVAAFAVIDGTHVGITFDRPVRVTDALTVANYGINNGLQVVAVTQTGPQSFTLTTSPQTPSTVYLVTISNIRDLAGNIP